LRAVAADPDVTGVDDARIGGAQSGQVSVESFTDDPVGGKAFSFEPGLPLAQVQAVKDMAALPLVLSAFLAVLAVGAVGHALSIAVRRRSHELAVLRALGLTRRQSRLVVVTQATLLAAIGIIFGIPLGVALGRVLWHAAADMTPLAYNPPWAALALLLIAPLALLAANLLAAWPARRAARLHAGQILRTE
jgi:ABC-type antimicrobial peptide transport system permease subunit